MSFPIRAIFQQLQCIFSASGFSTAQGLREDDTLPSSRCDTPDAAAVGIVLRKELEAIVGGEYLSKPGEDFLVQDGRYVL